MNQMDDSASDSTDNPRPDDGTWADAESDAEDIQIVCLFDDKTFSDVQSMVAYCREKYGFDLVDIQKRLSL